VLIIQEHDSPASNQKGTTTLLKSKQLKPQALFIRKLTNTNLVAISSKQAVQVIKSIDEEDSLSLCEKEKLALDSEDELEELKLLDNELEELELLDELVELVEQQ